METQGFSRNSRPSYATIPWQTLFGHLRMLAIACQPRLLIIRPGVDPRSRLCPLRFPVVPVLAWRATRPTPERATEVAGICVADPQRNLFDPIFRLFQETLGLGANQLFTNVRECRLLLRKSALQRPDRQTAVVSDVPDA